MASASQRRRIVWDGVSPGVLLLPRCPPVAVRPTIEFFYQRNTLSRSDWPGRRGGTSGSQAMTA
jgi:hypothetical protein